jgi:hypothetical protein
MKILIFKIMFETFEIQLISNLFRPPRSLPDLEICVTADDLACSSACLRVILGFQVP